MEWISVKEKVPPSDEWILIYAGFIEIAQYGWSAFHNKNVWRNASCCNEIMENLKLTHWMLLPSDPKE